MTEFSCIILAQTGCSLYLQ